VANLVLRRPRLKPEEGVRKVGAVVVHLRWKVVGFRFRLLIHQCRVVLHLMQVVRQGAFVVKELGIHRPAGIRVPQCIPQQLSPQVIDEVAEKNRVRIALIAVDHVAEPLVRGRQRAIVGFRSR